MSGVVTKKHKGHEADFMSFMLFEQTGFSKQANGLNSTKFCISPAYL